MEMIWHGGYMKHWIFIRCRPLHSRQPITACLVFIKNNITSLTTSTNVSGRSASVAQQPLCLIHKHLFWVCIVLQDCWSKTLKLQIVSFRTFSAFRPHDRTRSLCIIAKNSKSHERRISARWSVWSLFDFLACALFQNFDGSATRWVRNEDKCPRS